VTAVSLTHLTWTASISKDACIVSVMAVLSAVHQLMDLSPQLLQVDFLSMKQVLCAFLLVKKIVIIFQSSFVHDIWPGCRSMLDQRSVAFVL